MGFNDNKNTKVIAKLGKIKEHEKYRRLGIS